MSDVHPIAVALRDIRQGLRLTQQQVAAFAGVWQSSISDYESGRIQPSLDSLERWAGGLGYVVTLERAADE